MPAPPAALTASLTPRRTARHAAHSPIGSALAAGGLTAAFLLADAAAAAVSSAAVPSGQPAAVLTAPANHVARAAARTPPARHAAPTRASRSRVTAPRTAPVLDRAISLADRRSYRLVVAQWQARMKQRGWRITVDGSFGPQSARVAQRFAAEKGLRLPAAATVDRALYTAAWTAPIT